MKMRKLLAILLVIALLAADAAAIAEGILNLPRALKVIGEEAFSGTTGVDKIVVPEGTTTIESHAFAGSSASEIVLPSTLTEIADDAFAGSSIVHVRVPDNCHAYEWAAERGYVLDSQPTPVECFEVEELENGTLSIIAYTGEDKTLVIPDRINGKSVTEIGDSAFASMDIISAAIPEGITRIGDSAFGWNRDLVLAPLPSTLVELDDFSFNQCNLRSIELPEGLQSIGACAFGGNVFVKSIHIPASVSYIGEGAFYDCYMLESFTIESGNEAYEIIDEVLLSKDGEMLLFWIPGKDDTEYAVPEGVAVIGDYAFEGVDVLERIHLPESLREIGVGAFHNCALLDNVVIPDACTTIEGNAFEACSSLTEIVLPEGLEGISWATFGSCTSLVSATLPQSVRWIQGVAFDNCTALTTINLPKGIYEIADLAFNDCPNLHPTVVEGSYAHEWCEEHDVDANVVPDDEPGIPSHPYFETEILEDGTLAITGYTGSDDYLEISQTIGNLPVTAIGAGAFRGNTQLSTLIIPEGVVSIGDNAFADCENLWYVLFPGTLSSLGNDALLNTPEGNIFVYANSWMHRHCAENELDYSVTDAGCKVEGDIHARGSTMYVNFSVPEGVTTEYKLFHSNKGVILGEGTLDKDARIGFDFTADAPLGEYYLNYNIHYGFAIGGTPEVDSFGRSLYLMQDAAENIFTYTCGTDDDCTITGVKEAYRNEEYLCVPNFIENGFVLRIGDNAFAGCSALKEVELPYTLRSIGSRAFAGTVITDLKLPYMAGQFAADSFDGVCEDFMLVVNRNSQAHSFAENNGIPYYLVGNERPSAAPEPARDYEYVIADGACTITKYTGSDVYIAVPETIENVPVVAIGSEAFMGNQNLRNVDIPEGVVALGDRVFANCTSLISISFPASIVKLGGDMFAGVPNFNRIVYTNSAMHRYFFERDEYCILEDLKIDCNGRIFCPGDTFEYRFDLPDGVAIDYVLRNMDSYETLAEGSFDSSATFSYSFMGEESVGRYLFDYSETYYFEVNGSAAQRTGLGAVLDVIQAPVDELFVLTETDDGYILGGFKDAYRNVEVLIIPDFIGNSSVTAIAEGAFANCTSLKTIFIPYSVQEIGRGAFAGCTSLESADLSFALAGLSDSAFENCKSLTYIYLPNSIQSIGSRVFSGCEGLIDLRIPENVSSFAEDAFSDMPKDFMIQVLQDSPAHRFAEEHGVPFYFYGELRPQPTPVATATPVATLTPEATATPVATVTPSPEPTPEPTPDPAGDFEYEIIDNEFARITGYKGKKTAATLPAEIDGYQVTEIGNYAFWKCSEITRITVPDGVLRIGAFAFDGCTSLTEIHLPSSLNSIGELAFQSCRSIREIRIPDGVTSLGWNIFANCFDLEYAYIPTSVQKAGDNNISWRDGGKTICISGDIDWDSFSYWTEIEHVEVLDGCTSIGDGAFAACNSLITVALPESIRKMESRVFSDCRNLAHVNIPQNVSSIGDFTFANCAIEEVELPAGLKSIGRCAFMWCEPMKELVVPYGVTSIGEAAFMGCRGLERIELPSTVDTIEFRAFENIAPDARLYVHPNSYAMQYAIDNVIAYELIDNGLALPEVFVEGKNDSSVTIAWNAVDGAEYYEVYAADDYNPDYRRIASVEGVRFTHSDLICNTEYSYKVIARRGNQESGFSDEISVMTDDQLIELEAPQSIAMETVDENTLLLSWSMVEGADGYHVYSEDALIGKLIGADSTRYRYGGLEPESQHSLSVTAYAIKRDGVIVTGPQTDAATGVTAGIFTLEAEAREREIAFGDAIFIDITDSGGYGIVRCNCKFILDDKIEEEYDFRVSNARYTPQNPGIYSVRVTVTDELGRTAECFIEGILVNKPEFVVENVDVNGDLLMLGESVELIAQSNQPAESLHYSANIYRGENKVDQAVGVGKLIYTPDEFGSYSFALEVSDAYGSKENIHLDSAVKLVPYWHAIGLENGAVNKKTGDWQSFTLEVEGAVDGLVYDYRVYRDGSLFHEMINSNELECSFILTEPGIYHCECLISDAFGNKSTFRSEDITVTRDTVVNERLNTANYGSTLDMYELDRMDVREVRVESGRDITITWDKQSGDYYKLSISSDKLGSIYQNERYTKNAYTIPASELKPGYYYEVRIDRYDSNQNRISYHFFNFTVVGAASLYLEDVPEILLPKEKDSLLYRDLTVNFKKMNYADTISVTLEYRCGDYWHETLKTQIDGKANTFIIPKSALRDGKYHKLNIVAVDLLGNKDGDTCFFYVGCAGADDVRVLKAPVMTSDFLSLRDIRKIKTYPKYEPIVFSWEETPLATHFTLTLTQLDETPLGEDTLVFENIKTNSYAVPPEKLVSGCRYEVSVTAFAEDECPCSKTSQKLCFRAPYRGNLLLDPPVVTSPDFSLFEEEPYVFTKQDLTIRWEPVSAAKHYDVVMRWSEDENAVDFEAYGLLTPMVTIPRTAFEVGDEYRLMISAADANGFETSGNEYKLMAKKSDISTPVLISPALPTSAAGMPAFERKDIKLTWGAVSGAAKYRVKLYDYYGDEWDEVMDAVDTTGTSFTIPKSELYEGGSFRLIIKAFDQYGNSGFWSDAYYFRVGSSRFMELSEQDKSFDDVGGSSSFHLHTSDAWTAKSSASWISLNQMSGAGSSHLTVTVAENSGDFPRSGNISFTNNSGGHAVLSVVQKGNSAANSGALRITSPEQGDTLEYENIRVWWEYKYEHAYYKLTLRNMTTGKTVYTQDKLSAASDVIPQSVLTYGHIYALTIAAMNSSDSRISESSIVFRLEAFEAGDEGAADTENNVIHDPVEPEGVSKIIVSGIENKALISKDDIHLSWLNVAAADYYWVALRDKTLYPEGTEPDVVKLIDRKTTALEMLILKGLLTEGHVYNLWIAAHKEDGAALICGENFEFSVVQLPEGDETPEATDTGIPSASFQLVSETELTDNIRLGAAIGLKGMVLANGGALNQLRVTVQDAETGEYCDAYFYDSYAISYNGSSDSFDLRHMLPIMTGEGTSLESSRYARTGSVPLRLDTAGKRYNIVVYGCNIGGGEMRALASREFTIKDEHRHTPSDVKTYVRHEYSPIAGDYYNHMATAIIWQASCTQCGEVYEIYDDVGYEGAYLPFVEEHSYSHEGDCWKCGYSMKLPAPYVYSKVEYANRGMPVQVFWEAVEHAEAYAVYAYDEKFRSLWSDEYGNPMPYVVEENAFSYAFDPCGIYYIDIYALAVMADGAAAVQSQPAHVTVYVQHEWMNDSIPTNRGKYRQYDEKQHYVNPQYKYICTICGIEEIVYQFSDEDEWMLSPHTYADTTYETMYEYHMRNEQECVYCGYINPEGKKEAHQFGFDGICTICNKLLVGFELDFAEIPHGHPEPFTVKKLGEFYFRAYVDTELTYAFYGEGTTVFDDWYIVSDNPDVMRVGNFGTIEAVGPGLCTLYMVYKGSRIEKPEYRFEVIEHVPGEDEYVGDVNIENYLKDSDLNDGYQLAHQVISNNEIKNGLAYGLSYLYINQGQAAVKTLENCFQMSLANWVRKFSGNELIYDRDTALEIETYVDALCLMLDNIPQEEALDKDQIAERNMNYCQILLDNIPETKDYLIVRKAIQDVQWKYAHRVISSVHEFGRELAEEKSMEVIGKMWEFFVDSAGSLEDFKDNISIEKKVDDLYEGIKSGSFYLDLAIDIMLEQYIEDLHARVNATRDYPVMVLYMAAIGDAKAKASKTVGTDTGFKALNDAYEMWRGSQITLNDIALQIASDTMIDDRVCIQLREEKKHIENMPLEEWSGNPFYDKDFNHIPNTAIKNAQIAHLSQNGKGFVKEWNKLSTVEKEAVRETIKGLNSFENGMSDQMKLYLTADNGIIIENGEGTELYIGNSLSGELKFGVTDSIYRLDAEATILPDFVSVKGEVNVIYDTFRRRKIAGSALISREEAETILNCTSKSQMLKIVNELLK